MFNKTYKNSGFLALSLIISGCATYPYPRHDFTYYHTTEYVDNNPPSYVIVHSPIIRHHNCHAKPNKTPNSLNIK